MESYLTLWPHWSCPPLRGVVDHRNVQPQDRLRRAEGWRDPPRLTAVVFGDLNWERQHKCDPLHYRILPRKDYTSHR